MNYGKVEEPNSSRDRYPSTARFAATSAILTVTLSKSDRAPTSLTVKARPGKKHFHRPGPTGVRGCGTKNQLFPVRPTPGSMLESPACLATQMLVRAVSEARCQVERIRYAAIDIHYYSEVPAREPSDIITQINNHNPEAARTCMYNPA